MYMYHEYTLERCAAAVIELKCVHSGAQRHRTLSLQPQEPIRMSSRVCVLTLCLLVGCVPPFVLVCSWVRVPVPRDFFT